MAKNRQNKRTTIELSSVYEDGGQPVNTQTRAIVAPKGTIIGTRKPLLRLEQQFTFFRKAEEVCSSCNTKGLCTLANTNHGSLFLCDKCIKKAMKNTSATKSM